MTTQKLALFNCLTIPILLAGFLPVSLQHSLFAGSALPAATAVRQSTDDNEAPDDEKADPPSGVRKGYNGLFMGHSFFWPSANQFKGMITQTSVQGHQQKLVRAGGRGGSPGALWNSKSKREEAQNILDTKKIDLLVMTFFSPQDSSVQTYSRWIDYAIDKNPNTTIMIAIPWAPQLYSASPQRRKLDKAAGQLIYDTIISALRKKYPDNRILYCPYGYGTYELIDRLEDEKLPGVKHVLNPNRQQRGQSRRKKDQLLNDELGHAGELVTTVATMIWLKTLYDYDLSTLKKKSVPGLPDIDCAEIATVAFEEFRHFNEKKQQSPSGKKGATESESDKK